MIYKINRMKDWVCWMDWIMTVALIYLFILVIPTLKMDNFGIDSFYMHKFLFVAIGYLCIRLYINQNRMLKVLRELGK